MNPDGEVRAADRWTPTAARFGWSCPALSGDVTHLAAQCGDSAPIISLDATLGGEMGGPRRSGTWKRLVVLAEGEANVVQGSGDALRQGGYGWLILGADCALSTTSLDRTR
jgi:hypothetical protein